MLFLMRPHQLNRQFTRRAHQIIFISFPLTILSLLVFPPRHTHYPLYHHPLSQWAHLRHTSRKQWECLLHTTTKQWELRLPILLHYWIPRPLDSMLHHPETFHRRIFHYLHHSLNIFTYMLLHQGHLTHPSYLIRLILMRRHILLQVKTEALVHMNRLPHLIVSIPF